MPPRALTREEVRRVDRVAIDEFGMAGVVLMENAGRGAAERLLSLGVGGPVAIVAGKGNNGGDGFVMARHLENRGVCVRVLLLGEPERLTGDAAINWAILEKAGTSRRAIVPSSPNEVRAALATELADADWIVDAVLGTGTLGEVREPFVSAIEAINAAGKRVLAVDLPSGLDCDTGRPLGPCVRAAHTATFVARKVGFDTPGSDVWTGIVHVVDIGAPLRVLERIGS